MKRGSGSFKIIRAYDPAIDFDAITQEALTEFLSTRDVELIEGCMVPDERPVVFHARPLGQAERRSVRALSDADKYERAFALCITRVENHMREDGSRSEWIRPNDGAKARPLGDMHLAMFSEDDVQHVGQVIIAFSFCSPDRQPFVPLLGTCRDALTAAELRFRRRRAAQTIGSSASGADKPHPAATDPAHP